MEGRAEDTFVALHDDPDAGPDAFVDEFCRKGQPGWSNLKSSDVGSMRVPRGRSWEAMVSGASRLSWGIQGPGLVVSERSKPRPTAVQGACCSGDVCGVTQRCNYRTIQLHVTLAVP